MKHNKKILGMVVGTLVFLGSSSTVKADVLIDNLNANNSYGYSIKNCKTYTDNQSTNCSIIKGTGISNKYSNIVFRYYGSKGNSNLVTIPNSQSNTGNDNTGSNAPSNNSNTNTGSNTPSSNGNTNTESNTPSNNSGAKDETTTPSNNGNTSTESTQQEYKGISAEERKLFDLINQERKKAGVSPLQIDEKTFKAAKIKSQDMNDNSYFSHTSPTFGSSTTLLKNEGVSYRYFGENIAKNYSVENAHNSLMNSEGHRKNILNPNYTHVGIGIVNGYYTEIFIGK